MVLQGCVQAGVRAVGGDGELGGVEQLDGLLYLVRFFSLDFCISSHRGYLVGL